MPVRGGCSSIGRGGGPWGGRTTLIKKNRYVFIMSNRVHLDLKSSLQQIRTACSMVSSVDAALCSPAVIFNFAGQNSKTCNVTRHERD